MIIFVSAFLKELPFQHMQTLIENDIWHEAAKLTEEKDGGVGKTLSASVTSEGIVIENRCSSCHLTESFGPASYNEKVRDKIGETEPDLEVANSTSRDTVTRSTQSWLLENDTEPLTLPLKP